MKNKEKFINVTEEKFINVTEEIIINLSNNLENDCVAVLTVICMSLDVIIMQIREEDRNISHELIDGIISHLKDIKCRK